MKKVLSLLLAAAIAFAFAACGNSNSHKTDKTVTDAIIFENEESVMLEAPDNKVLNPADVYSKIEYTPKMFYGRYMIKEWFTPSDKEEGYEIKTFKENAKMIDDPYSDDDAEKISSLPYYLEAGPQNMDHVLSYATEKNWMRVQFFKEGSESNEKYFAYEVKGNKLILTGVEYSYDEGRKKLDYKLIDDIRLEYEFKFAGRELTLSDGTDSVTLSSGYNYSGDREYYYSDKYVCDDSPRIDDIILLSYRWDEEEKESRFYVEYEYTDEDGALKTETLDNAVAELKPEGTFTFTVPYETGTKTYQYVYFLCDDDGLILSDGDKSYYFNDTFSQFNKYDIGKNVEVEQIEELEGKSEEELKQIEEKKTDLLGDLSKAFKDAGIDVDVNRKTGELAMDSAVLFGGDSAEISADGKAFLNKFVKAYTEIIYNEKYDGFIRKTVVEGHIAPISGVTYKGGLPLSEKRAKNVMDYCLSKETGTDTSRLAKTMETVGYSNSKPVYDKDGNVDLDASRRVSFRFIINID